MTPARRDVVRLLALTGWLMGCQAAPPAATCHVAVLGTSLTAGYGLEDPASFAWPAPLRDQLASGSALEVLGIPGSTAASWAPVVRAKLRGLPHAPNYVIIELGANEMLQGTSPTRFAQDYRALLDSVRSLLPAAQLALVRVPPGAAGLLGERGRSASAVADTITALGDLAGWPVVMDLLEDVRFVARYNQDDGAHPNAMGAQLAFRNAWRTLQPWLRRAGCLRA